MDTNYSGGPGDHGGYGYQLHDYPGYTPPDYPPAPVPQYSYHHPPAGTLYNGYHEYNNEQQQHRTELFTSDPPSLERHKTEEAAEEEDGEEQERFFSWTPQDHMYCPNTATWICNLCQEHFTRSQVRKDSPSQCKVWTHPFLY